MPLTLERPVSTARLAPAEQAVHDFVAADRSRVERFVDSLGAACREGTPKAASAHLARTDADLHAVYDRWLAMALVAGRVHTLERTYESVLSCMLRINHEMKAVLAVTGEEGTDPTLRVTRERLRLTMRVDWTDRELQVLSVHLWSAG